MYSSIKYQMLTTFVYKHKYISIYFYLLHVWLVFKKESETRHFHWCSCDTACSEKVNTEATDPSWWQRLLHFNVMRVKIRRQLTWVQLWWQQLKTLHPLWSSQSLLILTHDSVCFVPCLADGPEISADQEGAVPPYPSSASAFPSAWLVSVCTPPSPIYPLPSLWWILPFFLNPEAGFYSRTCRLLCLWKRLFVTNPPHWIAGKSCKRPDAEWTCFFSVLLLLILWSELRNMLEMSVSGSRHHWACFRGNCSPH